MATAPTALLLTLEQFQSLPDDGQRYELDEGVLISMSRPNLLHCTIVQNINEALAPFVRQHRLGRIHVEPEYILQQTPPTVRVPDLAFLAADRFAQVDLSGYALGGPTLAVEVVSPSDRAEELDHKVAQYLAAQAEAVWVLDPKTCTMFVYRRAQPPSRFDQTDILTDPLFPGWSVPVAQMFETASAPSK